MSITKFLQGDIVELIHDVETTNKKDKLTKGTRGEIDTVRYNESKVIVEFGDKEGHEASNKWTVYAVSLKYIGPGWMGNKSSTRKATTGVTTTDCNDYSDGYSDEYAAWNASTSGSYSNYKTKITRIKQWNGNYYETKRL